jgi:DNA polymerase (family 10)
MSSGRRYKLEIGQVIADAMLDFMGNVCERIEVAGSIRRKKEDVGDVEIVCIPKVHRLQQNMFGVADGPMETPLYNRLRSEEWLSPRLIDGKPQAMGKRFLALYDNKIGIPVDVFVVLPPAQWGVIMTFRTGSADFNKKLLSAARRRNLRCEDGHLVNGTKIIQTPTEESFFEAVGVSWVPLEQRG